MRVFACDFETTVDDDTNTQEYTEVWSAALSECDYGNNDYEGITQVFGNIKDFLNFFFALPFEGDSVKYVLYFHNLRFDGSFIVDFLLKNGFKFLHETRTEKLRSKEFDALISAQNRWYSLKMRFKNVILEIRDSAKLVPMSLKDAGKAFKTVHQKLEMEYKGNHYANCPIDEKTELPYILNDVWVLKEVIEFMYHQGHSRLTIGSNCVADYKEKFRNANHALSWDEVFVDLKNIKLPDSMANEFYSNAHEYINKTYKGGWCFLKKGYSGKIIINGHTFDVNSLYSSEMHSVSGNRYAIGNPMFFLGQPDWNMIKNRNLIYVVHLKCCFNLLKDHLPTIQIKDQPRFYRSTEWLETSDVFYKGKKYSHRETENGETERIKAELWLLPRDYELLMTHYEVTEIDYIDGCYFYSEVGLFDDYINEWMEIKMNSTGGMRTESKLFLNNLYGKLASSDDSSYVVPYLENDVVQLHCVEERNKKVLSIINGSLVTSYARYFTITHAQQNYKYFIYADTDSLHMINPPGGVKSYKGLKIHESDLRCWKHESSWEKGKFLRQKTYIEISDGVMEIKCAGMSDTCKENYIKRYGFSLDEFDFTNPPLCLEGKLRPKRVKGGTVLTEGNFTLRR